MITLVKQIVKRIIPKRLFSRINESRYLKDWRRNQFRLQRHNIDFTIKERILKCKIAKYDYHLSQTENFAKQFHQLCQQQSWIFPDSYIYPFDSTIIRAIPHNISQLYSMTADYGTILEFNIDEVRNNILQTPNKAFQQIEFSILESIEILVNRIIDSFGKSERENTLIRYFKRLLYKKPLSLDEALQKILFFHALFYQAGHMHNGLGRLDLILYPYYQQEISVGTLTRENAKELLKKFCHTLGYQSHSKSISLLGDTGQYILLGGIDQNNENIANDLTLLFLEIFSENHFPDPKLILRINEFTPQIVWEKAIQSIATGNGSPLLMNEALIMKNMVKFGYSANDVWNVGTSACWEPLIIGKSFDQNNPLPSINLSEILTNIIISETDEFSFDELLNEFKLKLNEKIASVAHDIKFDCSPLFTLFMADCITKGKDYTTGGAVYAFHGMQAVGLPNVINSLLNIKHKVFEKKLIPYNTLRDALKVNFEDKEDIRQILLSGNDKFGHTTPEIIKLTNKIMDFVNDAVQDVRINGRKVKIGFSSPSYITHEDIYGSADGRKVNEPLAVHISPTSSEIDISDVVDFASELHYGGNRLNGNVVDFILPSSYVKFPEKLIAILRNAIAKGIFELQLNVLDKATLIDAKHHPEKYPNLIVRVWGFSAYFNELPEEYKDNLIARAAIYEAS